MSFLIALLATPLRGWVLLKLWFWFLVPLGVPVIQMAHALGISLLISFVTFSASAADEAVEEKMTMSEQAARAVGICVLVPLIVLLFGKVFKSFMS